MDGDGGRVESLTASSLGTPGTTFTATTIAVLQPVAALVLAPSSSAIAIGEALPLTATALDGAGVVLTGRAISYQSANSAVASVNSSGVVVGVGVGQTTITATAEGVSSQAQITVLAAAPAPPPAAPSALTATSVSSSQIDIAWQDNSTTETGFEPEFRLGTATTWSALATVAANATSYRHTGLTSVTAYTYRLRACLGANCSHYSSESSATTGSATVGGAPTVTTGTVTTIRPDIAIDVYGTVVPNGLPTTGGFEYGTSPTLIGAVATGTVDAGQGTLPYSLRGNFTGLTAGTTYYYRAVGQNSAGRTTGAILSFRTGPPDAPTNVQTTEVPSALAVNVRWTHPGTNAVTEFRVYRRPASQSLWTLVRTLPPGARSHQDGTYELLLTPQDLVYRVEACNDTGCATSGESAISVQGLAAPSNLVLTASTATSATFSWTDNSNNETDFLLYQDGNSPVRRVSAGVTQVTITGLTTGQTYRFDVRAYHSTTTTGSGPRVSAPSNEVVVVPQ